MAALEKSDLAPSMSVTDWRGCDSSAETQRFPRDMAVVSTDDGVSVEQSSVRAGRVSICGRDRRSSFPRQRAEALWTLNAWPCREDGQSDVVPSLSFARGTWPFRREKVSFSASGRGSRRLFYQWVHFGAGNP